MLLTALLIVAGVLIAAWLTGVVPGLFDLLSFAPFVIVGLVVVTIVVLVRALVPRPR